MIIETDGLRIINNEIDRLEHLLDAWRSLDSDTKELTKNKYDILGARLQGLLYAKRAVFDVAKGE
jgi:hypothetical protein